MKGRFAPSPSGRMHLGNVYTALLSWLSVRRQGGKWILRIEDLDPQRSKLEHARMIEDDLHWLGLEWDEGGLDDRGPDGPYRQSLRSSFYEAFLERLNATGYTYPCYCTRAEIMATQAPHQSDGRIIYAGTCRPARLAPGVEASSLHSADVSAGPSGDCGGMNTPAGPSGHCGGRDASTPRSVRQGVPSGHCGGKDASTPGSVRQGVPSGHCGGRDASTPGATRLWVPDRDIEFDDMVCGHCSFNLAREVGDFVLRRADGAWAYQLAVVVDDALMGVTEVLRGDDLLLSAAQQIYLYELLGFAPPRFAHVPLVRNEEGRRLSKRDASLSMAFLREHYSPEEVIGMAAFRAGLIPKEAPVKLHELKL